MYCNIQPTTNAISWWISTQSLCVALGHFASHSCLVIRKWRPFFRSCNAGNMKGEPKVLGSVLVIANNGEVVFHHKEKVIGDHPNYVDLEAALSAELWVERCLYDERAKMTDLHNKRTCWSLKTRARFSKTLAITIASSYCIPYMNIITHKRRERENSLRYWVAW